MWQKNQDCAPLWFLEVSSYCNYYMAPESLLTWFCTHVTMLNGLHVRQTLAGRAPNEEGSLQMGQAVAPPD